MLEKIAKAKSFVQSLELKTAGFDYIEDLCLSQLDSFAESGIIDLNSFSVLVPKNRAVTPTNYGTYNGITFYSAYYSEYTTTTEEIKLSERERMQKWIVGAFNLAVSVGPAQ